MIYSFKYCINYIVIQLIEHIFFLTVVYFVFQRFPVRTNKEFIALLYFSPICPAEEDGQPPTGIDYYELHLRRTGLYVIVHWSHLVF